MSTDYDAPRRNEEDLSDQSVPDELKSGRRERGHAPIDDENESAESIELPGADLSGEELRVRVLPRQGDEFTCSRCFLVHHRSQLATEKKGQPVCSDCAA
ncbi:MAG: DUF4193 domain-containing protein [Carbonactinosporaceae bacterium]